MRAVLQAISEELLRLKADGEQSVSVSEETLVGLRAMLKARAAGETAAAGSGQTGAGAGGVPVVVPALPGRAMIERTKPAVIAAREAAPAAPALRGLVSPNPIPAGEALPPPVVVLPEGDQATRWAALREMVTSHPVCVEKAGAGNRVVFGGGPLGARIFFVGDAPGIEEEIAGVPFVGPAGHLLDKMIAGMGLKREHIYASNILTWRLKPPGASGGQGATEPVKRSASAEEIGFCLPFLRAEIEVVQPELIVALGGTAAQGLLGAKFTSLPAARSKWHEFAGKPMMVTYHPAYLLQSGSKKSKRAVWEDLLKVMERAALPISEKQRAYYA